MEQAQRRFSRRLAAMRDRAAKEVVEAVEVVQAVQAVQSVRAVQAAKDVETITGALLDVPSSVTSAYTEFTDEDPRYFGYPEFVSKEDSKLMQWTSEARPESLKRFFKVDRVVQSIDEPIQKRRRVECIQHTLPSSQESWSDMTIESPIGHGHGNAFSLENGAGPSMIRTPVRNQNQDPVQQSGQGKDLHTKMGIALMTPPTDVSQPASPVFFYVDDLQTPSVEGDHKNYASEDINERETDAKIEANRILDQGDLPHEKTEIIRNPPQVWANTRTALCESVKYFHAYQGGLHTFKPTDETGKIIGPSRAAGILVDKYTTMRDRFGTHVLIYTIGGGRSLDLETKTRVRTADTPKGKQYHSFMESKRVGYPIVVIAGNEHPNYPRQPPHPYCVLGNFYVTDMWSEKVWEKEGTAPISVWRVRLERMAGPETPWWAPENPAHDHDAILTEKYKGRIQTPTYTCATCKIPSKKVFDLEKLFAFEKLTKVLDTPAGGEITDVATMMTKGWTCLNRECESYFKCGSVNIEDFSHWLAYADEFLAERSIVPDRIGKDLVAPVILKEELRDLSGDLRGTETAFRKGIVCPSCGGCASRRFWNRWECPGVADKTCDFQLHSAMKDFPQEAIRKEHEAFEESKSGVVSYLAGEFFETQPTEPKLGPFTTKLGSYDVTTLVLPAPDGTSAGSMSVFRSNDAINARSGGANDLFKDLCTRDIGLKRNVVAGGVGCKSEGLTAHFQQNFGAPYKFIVKVMSKTFDEAPDVILNALKRLTWAGQKAAGFFSVNSNFEWKQDFNELLALGYMANDHISYHDDGEKELGPTVATLSLGSPSLMRFRPKLKKWDASTKGLTKMAKAYKHVVELALHHGDMVVMHGEKIQMYYEHEVVPRGDRRFALTSRYVNPDRMADEEEKRAALVSGTIPERAARLEYHGD